MNAKRTKINELHKRLLAAEASEKNSMKVSRLLKAVNDMQINIELLRTENCNIEFQGLQYVQQNII